MNPHCLGAQATNRRLNPDSFFLYLLLATHSRLYQLYQKILYLESIHCSPSALTSALGCLHLSSDLLLQPCTWSPNIQVGLPRDPVPL